MFLEYTIASDWEIVPEGQPLHVGDVVTGKMWHSMDKECQYKDTILHLKGSYGIWCSNVASFVRQAACGCRYWLAASITVYRCTLGTVGNPYRPEHFVKHRNLSCCN